MVYSWFERGQQREERELSFFLFFEKNEWAASMRRVLRDEPRRMAIVSSSRGRSYMYGNLYKIRLLFKGNESLLKDYNGERSVDNSEIGTLTPNSTPKLTSRPSLLTQLRSRRYPITIVQSAMFWCLVADDGRPKVTSISETTRRCYDATMAMASSTTPSYPHHSSITIEDVRSRQRIMWR